MIKYKLFFTPSTHNFAHHQAHLVYKTISNTIIFTHQQVNLCAMYFFCEIVLPGSCHSRVSMCDTYCFKLAVLQVISHLICSYYPLFLPRVLQLKRLPGTSLDTLSGSSVPDAGSSSLIQG